MRLSDRGILWLAEGFGSGRLRPGPGTWGSLVGCALSYPLLSLPLGTAVIVTLAAILLAVPVCSRAEVLLGKTDPGSVVLDEIVAIPLTLLPLHAGVLLGAIHPPRVLTSLPTHGLWWLAAFALFRVLDIGKPGPIGALQHLPRGWGIVMDDVAAGLITGLILLGAGWMAPTLVR
jgi:phosphatidylglycerophosphatase A